MNKAAATVTSIAGLRNVRAALADAQEVPRVKMLGPAAGGRADVKPGEWVANALGLPGECPVIPLGIQGNTGWFLDPLGQVQSLPPPYNRGQLLGLFLGQDLYLAWHWPKFNKDGGHDNFKAEDVGPALLRACAAKGPWKAADRIRGRGNWTDGNGNLVTHLGKTVVTGGRAMAPGEFDGMVYPAGPKLPGPFPAEEVPDGIITLLRHTLRSWSWQRGEVDMHLLMGWIGAAFLGAALPWRPMIFITGDKGTGKSTLQSLIKAILGDWLITAADTTAAGIYQHIGLDSVAVAIDELESESDNKKVAAVLKLARLASSGAVMMRGGDRHSGVEFQARSAFLFSSINAPPLPPQDLSRMGLLRLEKLRQGVPAPQIDPMSWSIVGRCILRRLMAQWGRFHETFNAFAAELGAAGMDGRGQAQFGTLLTCADLIEHDGWDESRLRFLHEVDGDLVPWRQLLAPNAMHEFEDQTENWRSCLSHLLGVRVEAWRGGKRQTVGQVVLGYFARDEGMGLTEANELLGQAGLRITYRMKGTRPEYFLAVPNQSPLVRELFKDSHWAGVMGAAVWSAALRQGPKDALWRTGQCRINGSQYKGTWLSLEGLYGTQGVMREEAEDGLEGGGE